MHHAFLILYEIIIYVSYFQFGADGGKGGSGTSATRTGQEEEQPAPKDDGETIKYPDEEINPEDIPF